MRKTMCIWIFASIWSVVVHAESFWFGKLTLTEMHAVASIVPSVDIIFHVPEPSAMPGPQSLIPSNSQWPKAFVFLRMTGPSLPESLSDLALRQLPHLMAFHKTYITKKLMPTEFSYVESNLQLPTSPYRDLLTEPGWWTIIQSLVASPSAAYIQLHPDELAQALDPKSLRFATGAMIYSSVDFKMTDPQTFHLTNLLSVDDTIPLARGPYLALFPLKVVVTNCSYLFL